MLIPCPYCGNRPVEEFTFLGDADVRRPESVDQDSMEQWFEYVYLRKNPKGLMSEYVHHSGGCRGWLVLSRNTLTHEVYGSVPAREHKARQR